MESVGVCILMQVCTLGTRRELYHSIRMPWHQLLRHVCGRQQDSKVHHWKAWVKTLRRVKEKDSDSERVETIHVVFVLCHSVWKHLRHPHTAILLFIKEGS